MGVVVVQGVRPLSQPNKGERESTRRGKRNGTTHGNGEWRTHRESTSGGATAASRRARSGIKFITLKNGISPSLALFPSWLSLSEQTAEAGGGVINPPRACTHTEPHTLSLSLQGHHHASSCIMHHHPSTCPPWPHLLRFPKVSRTSLALGCLHFHGNHPPTNRYLIISPPPPPLRTDFHVRSRGHRGRGRPSPISLYFLPRSQPTRTDSDPSEMIHFDNLSQAPSRTIGWEFRTGTWVTLGGVPQTSPPPLSRILKPTHGRGVITSTTSHQLVAAPPPRSRPTRMGMTKTLCVRCAC